MTRKHTDQAKAAGFSYPEFPDNWRLPRTSHLNHNGFELSGISG